METIEQAMLAARRAGVDRLDIQVMLTTLLGQSRSWLLAHDRDPLPQAVLPTLRHWIERRAAGEPLAYLLGEKEFFGLNFRVNPEVLIPRPDTEILVEWALEHLPLDQHRDVLDLGTGSGAIALAVAHQRPQAAVTAVDASPAALETARRNAERLGVSVRFRLGSWLAPVGSDRFDLIVSNPPYIAEGDAHLPALKHEPITALTSGPDGLDDIRHIVTQAKTHLRPGGWLLLEHGFDQAGAVSQLLKQAGYDQVTTRRDLGGQNRCTGGQTL
ncbi:MAG: peptide chain release factor N(5)-glutamine methyltransferase [Burkholderiales bacterium]|nr:peptide chain release factor N(5)-glutamine methyltransferase [Burkholderiales bacterium]